MTDGARERLLAVLRQEEPERWRKVLEPLLAAVAEEEDAPVESPWTAGCLNPLRQHRAALREDLSAEERAHVDGCATCRRTRVTVEEAAWHPTSLELCRYLASEMDHEDTETQAVAHDVGAFVGSEPVVESLLGRLRTDEDRVAIHLSKDGCRRCARLARSPWLTELAGRLRRGRVSAEEAAQSLTPSAWGALRADRVGSELKAVVSYSSAERRPVHLRAASAGGELAATLRELSPGSLVVTVEASDLALAGRGVRVEVVGEDEPFVVTVTLEATAEGCLGEERFLEETSALAAGASLFAVLERQDS